MRKMDKMGMLRTVVLDYGVALVATLVAVAIWLTVAKSAEPDPFPLFLLAVLIAAYVGGLGPAAAGIAFTVGLAIILYPHHGMQLGIYVLLGVVVAWLVAPVRRAQQQLSRNIQFTKGITRNLGDGVWVLDPKGTVTYTNEAAEKLLGWTLSEVRGRDGHSILRLPMDVSLMVDGGQASDSETREGRFARRDGPPIPVEYSLSPIDVHGNTAGRVLAFHDVSQKKQAIELLRTGQQRYRSMVEAAPMSILLTDMYGFIGVANERAAQLFGYGSPQDMVGVTTVELVAPQDRQRSIVERQRLGGNTRIDSGEYRLLKKSGHEFSAQIETSVRFGDDGEPADLVTFIRDITHRKEVEIAAMATESRIAMQQNVTAILNDASSVDEGVWKAMQAIATGSGWDVGLYWGMDGHATALRCVDIWQRPGMVIPDFSYASREANFPFGVGLPGAAWARGQYVWHEDVANDATFSRAPMASKEGLAGAAAMPVRAGDAITGVLEFFSRDQRPADERLGQSMTWMGAQIGQFVKARMAEKDLAHQTFHDALTGLPNRALLLDRLKQAILTTGRTGTPVTILLLDLDGFKDVNDALGQGAGDLLLRQVADRLRDSLRESDTVARLGADEFAVLLPGADGKGALLAAKKAVSAVAAAYELDGKAAHMGVSVGVALYPIHGDSVSSLMHRADVAMQVAKRTHSGYALYDTEIDDLAPNKLLLMADLRSAIESDEIVVHYQPIVQSSDMQPRRVEALAYWPHPRYGMLGPEHFVPLAETMGIEQALMQKVVCDALRQCRDWADAGLPVETFVNLSVRCLQDEQFVGMIGEMLRTCGLDASSVTLGMAERAVMADPDRAMAIVNRLDQLGIGTSLVNFGTGVCSLTYVGQLPLTAIKIDPELIRSIEDNPEATRLLRSIVDIGRNSNILVIADGIESRDAAEQLRSIGCDCLQGPAIGAPLAPEVLLAEYGQPAPRLRSIS